MSRPTLQRASAFLAGAVFAVGLALSGMTQPFKVIGFLDVFGHWDPSLLLVMLGAIGVHSVAYRIVTGKPGPLFDERWAIPVRRDIDAKLLLGASIFGVGWGLAGYCPGPGIVSTPSGSAGAVLFTGALIVGTIAAATMEATVGRTRRRRETSILENAEAE